MPELTLFVTAALSDVKVVVAALNCTVYVTTTPTVARLTPLFTSSIRDPNLRRWAVTVPKVICFCGILGIAAYTVSKNASVAEGVQLEEATPKIDCDVTNVCMETGVGESVGAPGNGVGAFVGTADGFTVGKRVGSVDGT